MNAPSHVGWKTTFLLYRLLLLVAVGPFFLTETNSFPVTGKHHYSSGKNANCVLETRKIRGISDSYVNRLSFFGCQFCAAYTKDDCEEDSLPLPQSTDIWTTAELMRRQTERRLLKQLLYGDEAIAELRKLWFSERGLVVQEQMYIAEAAIGHPQNWTVAESILETLIYADPTYIEPFVRLSKLYCLQGRFEESGRMCQAALENRPWHYVALVTMAVLDLVEQKEGDEEQPSKRLPPPSKKDLRKQWVEQAVGDSMQIEQDAMMARRIQLDDGSMTDSQNNNSWQ
jgi:hypothetical protein